MFKTSCFFCSSHSQKLPFANFSEPQKCRHQPDPVQRSLACWCAGIVGIFFRALRADVPLFPESLTRKLYIKKIPENTLNVPGVPGNFRYRNSPALSGTSHSPKISGKLPGPVPVMFRQFPNAPRSPAPAAPIRKTGQPPGFSGDGWGMCRKFPGRILYEIFSTEI